MRIVKNRRDDDYGFPGTTGEDAIAIMEDEPVGVRGGEGLPELDALALAAENADVAREIYVRREG